MKSKHDMPFGAECRGDGTARFRLWAPTASAVELILKGGEFAMCRLEQGWFELVIDAPSGSEYQFQIDAQHRVPDIASRYQPEGVHGASEVINPTAFDWQDTLWRGRPWEEAVIYELHVGTFSPEGTFAGVEKRLGHLVALGVTAIELMPLASFPGERNWGYDGVLPYAAARCYGRPDDLKRLIDRAHARGLMVLLDVVYNHLGPEGNYLSLYAPQWFTDRHRTPWGPAINFDGPCSRTVREYFIHNALYWLEEYHFDGLRLDAVHAIRDDSRPDILTDLAAEVRERLAADRAIHLVLENDNNAAGYLTRDARGGARLYTAQWNDDIHHALHCILTGETGGYYADYAQNPTWHVGRCLAEGFSYQGESSAYRGGALRGEPSRNLPPTSFVAFLQNHDQVGNRAMGERIVRLADHEAVRAAMAVLLLAPCPPLLFMGEEFAATTPFLFFCDFGPELAAKVRDGRRAEFAQFDRFHSREAQAQIPDPNNQATFLASKLDWASVELDPHRQWLQFYRQLLALRRETIVPRIQDILAGQAQYQVLAPGAVRVRWMFAQGGLELLANLSRSRIALEEKPQGHLFYTTASGPQATTGRELSPLATAWFLNA
jgi:maltooligosyltrehalose trehalohydrolase